MNEIAAAAESSRDARTQLVDEFRGKLSQLIDGRVDASRRSE